MFCEHCAYSTPSEVSEVNKRSDSGSRRSLIEMFWTIATLGSRCCSSEPSRDLFIDGTRTLPFVSLSLRARWHCVYSSCRFPDEKTGSLKLINLSSNMSGKYVCTASNSAASKTCTISLDIITCEEITQSSHTPCLFQCVRFRRDLIRHWSLHWWCMLTQLYYIFWWLQSRKPIYAHLHSMKVNHVDMFLKNSSTI